MRRLVVGLFAVLSLGVLAFAASAQANEWLCNGKAEQCKVLGENLETLVLEDMGLSASISCQPGVVKGEGTAGPGATGETTVVSAEGEGKEPFCKPSAKAENLKNEEVANAVEKVEKVSAVNLPWKGEIAESEEGLWWGLALRKEAGKEPGYELKVKSGGLTVTDVCTMGSETPLGLIENLAAEPGGVPLVSAFAVKALLNATEAGTCSLGGKENGLVVGETLLAGWTGTALTTLSVN
jgi:hypothetical protein